MLQASRDESHSTTVTLAAPQSHTYDVQQFVDAGGENAVLLSQM